MVPEVSSRNFAAIESSLYERHFAFIFDSKFWPTHNVVFLRAGSLKVRISNIGGLDVNIVEGSVCERDANALA